MHFSFSSNKANDRNKKHDFILFSQLSSSPWGVNFNFFMLSVFTVYTDNRVTFVYQFVLSVTHLWPFSKSKFNLKSDQLLVLFGVCFIYPMSRRYSTNWDRKNWPGSEIQMYYGCPCCLFIFMILSNKPVTLFAQIIKKTIDRYIYGIILNLGIV